MTTSRRDWLRVRRYLQQHRYDLGQAAAEQYPDLLKVEGTALLTSPEWLPAEPIPLPAIDLEFVPAATVTGRTGTSYTGLAGTDPVTAPVRPQRPDGTRYPTYSAALADLAAPAVFENRSTYRLLDADLVGPRPRLVFVRGNYFDGIDLGEAAAHESAAASLAGIDHTPLRATIGNPCDPARRRMNLAIGALTIRHDRATGEATFLLHWRDPAKVGHAGGLCMVVPVGIFQASNDQPCNERNDFSLWRCLIREYAEELLGESEDHRSGQAPIDYDSWPFAVRLTEALHSGLISAYVLGMGVDPLTLAVDLLTVVVFDAAFFDEIFADLVDTNAEGRLVSSTPSASARKGLPYTVDHVQRIVRNQPMQAAGAATLLLTQRSRIGLFGMTDVRNERSD